MKCALFAKRRPFSLSALCALVLFAVMPHVLSAQQKEQFFWDSLEVISDKNSYFPISVSDGAASYVFFEKVDKVRQEISVSWISKAGTRSWSPVRRLPDSFRYSGTDVPDMYSVAVSKNGVLAVSVLDSTDSNGIVKIYSSADHAAAFQSFAFPVQQKQVTSTRIFASTAGGFVLFVSLGEGKQSPTESSFSILYAESADGKKWSDLSSFKPAEMISNAFSPFLAEVNGTDMVVFEGWYGKDSTTSQVYSTTRKGSSWTTPTVVTNDDSVITLGSETDDDFADSPGMPEFLRYKNFRPMVLSYGGDTKITWERTTRTGATATVMVAPLSSDGKILDKSDVELLNQFGNGRRPSLFIYHNSFFILWFDNRNGMNMVHLAEYLGVQWVEIDSVTLRQSRSVDSGFACAVISSSPRGSETLSLVWHQQKSGQQQIALLNEDFTAFPPVFQPKNFKAGWHSALKNPSVRVVMPDDVSEIAGFSALWTFYEDEEPVRDELSAQFRSVRDNTLTAEIPADTEGDKRLFFKAAVLDRAGNWSDVAVLEYYFDQTPPARVSSIFFDKDDFGFALSNDVAFSWKPNGADEDIAGYSWTLSRIAPIAKNLEVSKTKKIAFTRDETQTMLSDALEKNADALSRAKRPSSRVQSAKPRVSFRNRDNGLYVFSVCVIDSVGNVSEPFSVPLFLNKYKAATVIKNVTAQADDFGAISLAITGQEFSYDGTITEVILKNTETGESYCFSDGNGYSLKKTSADTDVISGLTIDAMKSGTYTVQVRHSERGTTTWKNTLVIGERGTVKYEKRYNFEPYWKIVPFATNHYVVGSDIVFWCMIALVLLGMVACTRGIVSSAKDAVAIRHEIKHILQGDYMAEENIKGLHAAVRVKVSLKLKFALSITSLLLLIVIGISGTIGSRMMRVQEQILISSLKDRVKVVMGDMASDLQTYLDDGRDRIVEIGGIINKADNFAESKYATILSYQIDGLPAPDWTHPMDYVWATNDEDILSKIDASSFDAGTVRMVSPMNEHFREESLALNKEALEIVKDLSYSGGDSSSVIFSRLNELSTQKYGSFPPMSDEALDMSTSDYFFYWPVFYQKARDSRNVIQALILMKVDTSTLISQVNRSRNLIVFVLGTASGIAALFGILSAFMLASIITSPIQRIVSHVKKITETENKLLLENVEIKITSHDEIRTLGDSVNDMTRGLVQGAKNEERAKLAYQRAAKDREAAARARAETAELNIMNLDGQAVQKAFIPLLTSGTEKETTASYKDKTLEIFGYYEGTDAVSGDYFDYKKLDERWYAFIKCDASGHGVPAALIMTIVATIFRRYFTGWKYEKNGIKLDVLASDINDFIESLGLRGKFAAMMICLLDTKTGDVFVCNAGDNILHYFDSVERKMKVLMLHETPAAGPLPSFMVDMKGGYKVEKLHLKRSDVLFLYTDGIEESTRFFRNGEFEVAACAEDGLNEGDVHETHKKGDTSEQLESHRVQGVIEAVLNRKKYTLVRYHAPDADETLEFDFTKCAGTIEETIIALTAVEKVFRMYKKPGSTGSVDKTTMTLEGKSKTVIQITGEGVKIDRKIDAFLEKHFNRYRYYCENKVDAGEVNYLYYTGVSEDVQADDLTLLAIKKL